ncbi:MAG: DUF951 domain-containing protein [Kyrpidia tusciae]|nr:DUF951 domain-containing protein [Kyrpidia tusciae]MBE3552345.1 DUF951 domain-containing protein [Kyrpidia tusciae]
MEKKYQLGDVVEMKRTHPCGTNAWTIIRMGMDIRIKCVHCGRSVLLPRAKFERNLKRVIRTEQLDSPGGPGLSAKTGD